MARIATLPHLKRLAGNPGKRPIINSGLRGEGAPFIPDHLDQAAKECMAVIQGSIPPNVYAQVDSFMLAAFAVAYALHRQAVIEIGKPGFEHIVGTVKGGRQVNPWLHVLNTQAMLMASLGAKLGLDPVSRSRLHLPEDRPASAFAALTERAH